MPAKDVYQMRSNLYKGYKFNNFKANLDALRKRVTKDKNRADEDLAAFLHDMEIRSQPAAAMEAGRYPRWQDSDAEQLLKIDIDTGIGTSLKPEELWKSRAEYQSFPLDVFRKHIYQEARAEAEKSYWLHKKKQKEEKKKKQRATMTRAKEGVVVDTLSL